MRMGTPLCYSMVSSHSKSKHCGRAYTHADALNIKQNIFQRLRHELLRNFIYLFFILFRAIIILFYTKLFRKVYFLNYNSDPFQIWCATSE